MRIKQGNTYDIELQLEYEDGTDVTNENAAVVEISLGNLIKRWPGDVVYDDGKFIMPLSQEETFAMNGGLTLKARAKTLTGDVANGDVGVVIVGKSNSKVVL